MFLNKHEILSSDLFKRFNKTNHLAVGIVFSCILICNHYDPYIFIAIPLFTEDS